MKLAMGIVLAAAGLALTLPQQAARAAELTYFTGPSGGSMMPIGAGIKSLIEKRMPAVKIDIRPGGALINVKALEERKAQMGMGNMPSTVEVLQGTGVPQPYKNVCHVANLYPAATYVVVRGDGDIRSFADLKGKRVATLPRGNTTAVITEMLINLSGVGVAGIGKMNYVNSGDQINMFKDGQIDAAFMLSTIPSAAVMDIATSRPYRILDIPDDTLAKVRETNAGYTRYVLKKDSHPGLDRDVATMDFTVHLIVTCDLPADLAFGMAKALVEDAAELASINQIFKDVSAEYIARRGPVPFHPGAERYYRERGL